MKTLLPCLLAALLIAAPAWAATSTAPRAGIAATVNDDVITMSDVRNRVDLYLAGAKGSPSPEARRQLEQQTLDKLIDEKLQMQEAGTLGISVAQEQVNGAFASIAQQNKLPPDEFKKRLVNEGVKIDSLYDQIRAEIAWSQVVRRRLRPQINVSEAEIDSAMDQVSRIRGSTQYHVAEIFLAVPGDAQDAEVRKQADALVTRLAKGESFSSIAREASQAPGASQGGDLGWIGQGQLDPALDSALARMQPGQVSPPLRSQKGYHILFLREERQPSAASANASAPQPSGTTVALKQILIPVSPQDPQTIVAAKTARAEALKSEIASCEAMDAKMKDFAGDGTGDLGTGAIDSMPPVLRAAVENLAVGELSAPIRNDKGIAVVMVCARNEAPAPQTAAETPAAQTPAPPAPEKTDEAAREAVANQLGLQRLDQMQERYLRDLRASAYIEKRI